MQENIFKKLADETTRMKPVLPAEYVALVEQAIQKHAQVVQLFVSAAERAAARV